MKTVAVTVTTLEMTDREQLLAAPEVAHDELAIEQAASTPATSRKMYRRVGDEWCWHDRVHWSDGQWQEWLDDAGVRTWLAFTDGKVAGYFQLAFDGTDVEIAYFGLLREYFGRHWGAWFITRAVQCAWEAGARRVWLRTCTLDHPAALANYEKRGFRVVGSQTEPRKIGHGWQP